MQIGNLSYAYLNHLDPISRMILAAPEKYNYDIEVREDCISFQARISEAMLNQASQAAKEKGPEKEAPKPSYYLTQDQINRLKTKYNVSNLSVDEFHQLMDELSALGVVGEGEKFIVPGFNKDGYYTIRRPIILYAGAQKQGEGDRIFGREYFQDGDILSWLDEYKAKNDSWIDWFEQGNDKYSSPLQIMKNIDLYKQFNRDLGRIQSVLNQLR